jgi:hypothetical protein
MPITPTAARAHGTTAARSSRRRSRRRPVLGTTIALPRRPTRYPLAPVGAPQRPVLCSARPADRLRTAAEECSVAERAGAARLARTTSAVRGRPAALARARMISRAPTRHCNRRATVGRRFPGALPPCARTRPRNTAARIPSPPGRRRCGMRHASPSCTGTPSAKFPIRHRALRRARRAPRAARHCASQPTPTAARFRMVMAARSTAARAPLH